jgi:hypothetical protein
MAVATPQPLGVELLRGELKQRIERPKPGTRRPLNG